MGNLTSSMQPQELATFKRVPKEEASLLEVDIPERPEKRRPTNRKWGVALIATVAVLLPFLVYTLYYSDIRRIFGYDNCGNICGANNYHYDGIDCSGLDFTGKPYLQYNTSLNDEDSVSGGTCVTTCAQNYTPVFGICTREEESSEFEELEKQTGNVGEYLKSVVWHILISCALSVLFSMGMLFLFRYAVAVAVWGILGGCLLLLAAVTTFLWYSYASLEVGSGVTEEDKRTVLIISIVVTCLTVILFAVLIWCRKKIQLVIALLKETTKAVFAMPGLIAIPLVTVIVLVLLTLTFTILTLFMSSSGYLSRVDYDVYRYKLHPAMIVAIALNSAVYIWLTQFVTGLQYMVIAGAVAKWYFTRDKAFLRHPIWTSFKCAFKYHLGTVALGSLILSIVTIIKQLILWLIKNERIRAVVKSLVDPIEAFLKFLSKNAYIVTAMHGQPFVRSGKRAAKLILSNISDVISINFVGDFVLGMAQLLVVIVTLQCVSGLLAVWPSPVTNVSAIWAYLIVGLVSAVVVIVTFGVFETTIDTIFICYCEDALMNDGMARPYHMSRNLMEFIEDSKQVYGKK